MTDTPLNYFQLLHLPQQFQVDRAALDAAFHGLQQTVHPDRHVAGDAAAQRQAMESATLANAAYQTLKHPIARAEYLLQLAGVDLQLETNTAMPTDFLIVQMTLREAVAEARAANAVAALEKQAEELRQARAEYLVALAHEFDAADFDLAALRVRKLKFLDKLGEEIDQALDAVLG